ncbi:MAG: hypothetical protein ACI3XT_07805 [Butyricicoccaceae bacterium]
MGSSPIDRTRKEKHRQFGAFFVCSALAFGQNMRYNKTQKTMFSSGEGRQRGMENGLFSMFLFTAVQLADGSQAGCFPAA